MNLFTLKFLSMVVGFLAFTTDLFAADASADAAPIPEPSVALIGGLCGVLFLFWRGK